MIAAPKHVIGISGGKDSCALALRLMEVAPRDDYEFIFNGTGNELPELDEHIKRMETLLGKPFKFVGHTTDLYGLIDQVEMLPNFRARFCTRVLKIEPTIAYFESLPPGSVLYVGLRADEEERRGLYGEDIDVRFPLRDWGWGLPEVLGYLEERGVKIPLRTDCDVCPYQRLGEWRDLYFNYPDRYQKGIDYEQKYGHTFRSPGRDKWPAPLIELKLEFDKGRRIRGDGKEKPCRVCSM